MFGRLLLCAFACVVIGNSGVAQSKRELKASKTNKAIAIDGKLNELDWSNAEEANDFIVRTPNPGAKAFQPTRVKVIYDDHSLYIGAELLDKEPGDIQTQLSQRDEFDNVDWFSFVVSPYNDGINGVNFLVTAAGVQFDSKYSALGEDVAWNAVWESAVQIHDKGWTVEMRIPYSAIRFPEAKEQTWAVNFIRLIRRTREQSSWSTIDPQVDGFLNQTGLLTNINDIKPPIRLFLFPYVSGYMQNFDGEWGNSFNGGMDLKYGINDAFTLDMTLVPDFGQVQSDNKVLNLSPFEVRFNENRQFFTEGTELFNKGGLFYSRRVGGFPHAFGRANESLEENEVIEDLPTEGKLINASKLSGRTREGLGIGVFNAVTKNTYATIREGDETRLELIDPSTNYSVVVLDQNLPNNSFVSFVNTNVTRNGSFQDANVSGVLYRVRNKTNRLQTTGKAVLSKQYGDEFDNVNGYSYEVGVDKIGGNFKYGAGHNLRTDSYDINDLGFLTRNNVIGNYVYLDYNHFKPGKHFNQWWGGINTNYNLLYNPRAFTSWNVNGNLGGTTRGFNTMGINAGTQPIAGANYFEPRIPGKFYTTPANYYGSAFISSDYRKRFAYDVSVGATKFDQDARTDFNYRVSPRFRISDKSSIIYSYRVGKRMNEEGFATFDSTGTETIMGRRNVKEVTNLLNYSYIFTNTMGLSLRVRHYWSRVQYISFHQLNDDGYLAEQSYKGNNVSGTLVEITSEDTSPFNRNYNAFSVDLVYRWVFAPGSELSVVWKNNIEQLSSELEEDLVSDFQTTIANEQLNSFSIKLLYFIDYANLKRKR